MASSAPGTERGTPDSALALLTSLDQLDIERFAIVGSYIRYDEPTRSSLKEFRQRIFSAYQGQSKDPRNFLLWGAPGSGKSYLVRQISEALPGGVEYRELNLAQLDETTFASELRALEALQHPVLCLIDEVDSKPTESWPYELLLPALEPSRPPTHRICFCLTGSGGRDLEEMKAKVRARPKGADLLSRVASGNEFVVPTLGAGDKMLVSAVQLLMSAGDEGHSVREIEKLALYYIATQPTYSSARQLRGLAYQTALRIPPGEDRVKYDHLFHPGDPENKGFWMRSGSAQASLSGRFLHVEPGRLLHSRSEAIRAAPPNPPFSEAVRSEPTRVVVLPFTNISPDPQDEFFADGMTEELIEKLAHVAGLKVIARTTAMHYKNTRETASEIGRALRAGSVVECSVRKVGNQVRITAQLIDTHSETHLWASRYDRELVNIFEIQDDISARIASAVSVHLPLGARSSPHPPLRAKPETTEMVAYTDFLHARKLFFEKASEESIREARSYFQKAVDRDPSFARAWVGLADCQLWLGAEFALPYLEALRTAREDLAKALALDDLLAEAHSTLAMIELSEDHFAAASREARRAIALGPSLSDPYRILAQVVAGDGDINEAIRLLEVAIQVDPMDINILAFLGHAYLYAGREPAALAHWDRIASMLPYRTNSHRAEYYLARQEYGRAEECIVEMERLRPGNSWTDMYRGFYAARRGDRDAAQAKIVQLQQRAEGGAGTVFLIGFVQYALGDTGAFFQSMERAAEIHDLPALELLYSPLFAEVRGDPRFEALIAAHRRSRS
jgi:adenylate cyclase